MQAQVCATLLIALCAAQSASTSQRPLAPPVEIPVPKKFGERECEAGRSAATSSRGSFRHGWRICLEERSAGRACPELRGNGWLSNVMGYLDGNAAADRKYLEVEEALGRPKARKAAAAQVKALPDDVVFAEDPKDVCSQPPAEPKKK